MAFTYSGLAEIAGRRADTWLADLAATISRYTPSGLLQALETKATQAFRGEPDNPRHAFVGVGWAKFAEGLPFEPFIAAVSNALDGDWMWTPVARATFERRLRTLAAEASHSWAATGATLNDSEAQRISRELRSCSARGLGSSAYIRVLTEAVRRVAKTDPTVGQSLLAVCIPISALARKQDLRLLMGSSGEDREITSLYIPAGQDVGIQFGPHFVCTGIVTTDAQAGRLPPPSAPMKRAPTVWGSIVFSEQIVEMRMERRMIGPVIAEYRLPFQLLAETGQDPESGHYRPALYAIMTNDWSTGRLQAALADPRVFPVLPRPELIDETVSTRWLESLQRWLDHRRIPTSRVRAELANVSPFRRSSRREVVLAVRRGLWGLAPRHPPMKGPMSGGVGIGMEQPISDSFWTATKSDE